MIEFVQDDDRLRDERKKAKKNKDKYVGLSNESMGYRSRGFEGWQDRWGAGPTSSSSSGVTGGGFRDHSPDFDDNGRRSPVGQDDFRDAGEEDHDDDGFGELSRQRAGGGGAAGKQPRRTSPTGATTAEAKPKQQRVKKQIDLGAAAKFAQTAQVHPDKTQPLSRRYILYLTCFKHKNLFNTTYIIIT